MLEEKCVPIDDLLLDPNNPRFVRDLSELRHVPDERLEDHQTATLQLFGRRSTHDDEEPDVTDIGDLYDSMTSIGFVPIDRVVVRPVRGSAKYLVIEGNRRISTVKIILREFDEGRLKPRERRALEPLLDSFRTITCMLLDTEGLSDEDVERKVSVIMGLRHQGSLLEWGRLPKAYNIYNEYMSDTPPGEPFTFDNRKVRAVAGRLSVARSEVIKALKTYIAYLQLRERFPDVEQRHYSLIEAGVTNTKLQNSYFRHNESTFELTEESLAKLNALCQFSIRDAMPEGRKKIIADPKSFARLGRLVDKRQKADHEATKEYASDLIRRVEDDSDLEMTVEQALDALTAFENRKKWVEAVSKLLDKQQAELSYENYAGEGNDRAQKDELKKTLAPMRKIMDL